MRTYGHICGIKQTADKFSVEMKNKKKNWKKRANEWRGRKEDGMWDRDRARVREKKRKENSTQCNGNTLNDNVMQQEIDCCASL